MIPKSKTPSADSSLNVIFYSHWPEIFRSWFWRFYDHLFRLVFYNFAWVLSCYCIGWIWVHFKWVEISKEINLSQLFQVYFLYLVESAFSIGWAHLVFKIFIDGQGGFADFWIGTKKYLLKAIGVSAVSGLLVCLGLYNLYFYFLLVNENRSLAIFLGAFTLWILLSWLSTCLYQWPILFFQNPPFLKIYYKAFLLALGNGLVSLGILFFFVICFGFFLIVPFMLFFIGFVFFFSFQCVALEKNLLKYKITYGDKELEPFLEYLEAERQRSWRELLKPWGNR